MPLSYAISDMERLVRVNATGSVTSDDLRPLTSSLTADKNILPGMRFLVETAEVEPDITFTDLRNAAGVLTDLNAKGVRAMAIVTDTTHVYALAQVFAVFAPPATVEVRVFRERSEAMGWLDSSEGRTAS